ncbi:hypothetical protein AVEN_104710-1 [Araneus ventricosus]|uniref:Uncharacterized protein n=1 Tax=Araneus ventricosus TaxID=182803 RepID=A0A4Y2QQB7_ARAVE|nr:hypothetical protein AVEN_199404-1 [Araneus ventricosus]GBN66194.1 hypothetical protein AVEN_264086-1 [Araneus ventricosus]GBN90631.1 hypothetical protein AVEN_99141-1 [Araneus ventricosus]GBN90638.1 hypothetical protein AVEN_104710-1 [Araneus ventricosus]
MKTSHFFSNTRRTDIAILNRGQLTRTTPDPAPPPNFLSTSARGHLPPADLRCTRHAYTVVLRRNRVSNFKPSELETKTLPPGNRGLNLMSKRRHVVVT